MLFGCWVDFLISVSFWLALFFFQGLRELLPITGWAGLVVDHLHSVGIVLVFLILMFYLCWILASSPSGVK
jgi:hypothetical protein